MFFWWRVRDARAVHEVVRKQWSDELEARRAAEKKGDVEAAAKARHRAEVFGRLMQRLERRLERKGVLP